MKNFFNQQYKSTNEKGNHFKIDIKIENFCSSKHTIKKKKKSHKLEDIFKIVKQNISIKNTLKNSLK